MIQFAKKFYVTTAIAYPNGKPHLGHALEIIQADVIARFHRLLGKDVFFQTGTDEHGLKNWETAKKEGKEILEFLDGNVQVFLDLYKKLNISNDYFVRTSDKEVHYPAAQKLWKALAAAGDIYKKSYVGKYCAGCESFKTDRELEDGKCPNHPTRDIQEVEEENYFFRLSKYAKAISEKIASDEYRVIPESRKNEILSFWKEAKDISFSRPKTTLPWGIPVPDDPDHVMYVWCDALSNYITPHWKGSERLREVWPADIHVIGKDILRFHAGFWPAMLMSAGIELPKQLFVHGFILTRGAKMSKSEGNVIEPFNQIEKYGVDPFRFFLLEAMPIDGDGDYSEELITERINNELVANIGNFCRRTLSFLEKNFESSFTDIEEDATFFGEVLSTTEEIKQQYEALNFKEAIQTILHLSSLGNKYFQDHAPWKLIKEDPEKARRIIGNCVNMVKILGILCEPIMPSFGAEIKRILGLNSFSWADINFGLKNHSVLTSSILFQKVEAQQPAKAAQNFPLHIKVAEIKKVEQHPDADHLYVLQVNLGTEERQIVGGLKGQYTPDELLGKKLIVVTNLKPAQLRGVESQGMLLAVQKKRVVGVLTTHADIGTVITVDGKEGTDEEISIEQLKELNLRVKEGKAYLNDSPLIAKEEQVSAEKVQNGKIL